MSGERPTQTQIVEQTWQEIRELMAELGKLAESDLAPEDYFREFLQRVVKALAAFGGAVWAKGGEGNVELQYQMQLEQSGLLEPGLPRQFHDQLLTQAMTSGETLLVPPFTGPAGNGQVGNPTEFSIIVGSIGKGADALGVVEIFKRGTSSPAAQRGYVQFVTQVCNQTADYFKSRKLRQMHQRSAFWQDLDEFTLALHVRLDLQTAAYVLANEGQRLVGCDRLTVLLDCSQTSRVEAISGQDSFDKRSNSVRLVQRLSDCVAAAGDPVWFIGDGEPLPPQIEQAVTDYVEQSHAKTLVVTPMFRRPKPAAQPPEKVAQAEEPQLVGVLVAEWYTTQPGNEELQQRLDAVGEHGALALANAWEYHKVFLLPVWKFLGELIYGSKWKRFAAGLAGVTTLVLLLTFIPSDFQLSATGSLQPLARRPAIAPLDGVVDKVKVQHGQVVAEKAELILMRSSPLKQEITRITGEMDTTETKRKALSSLPQQDLTPTERGQLAADIAELRKLLQGLEQQLELVHQQEEELIVRSPIAGQVTTWDVADLLNARPVKRGDMLLELAQLSGRWVLEVYMPEDRMGHILTAQGQLGPELPVTFYLATSPENQYKGYILDIAKTAELHETEGNSVRLQVAFDKETVQLGESLPLRPGAGVKVKVYCGRRALGYVLFHDFYEFFQREVLFRLP